MIKYTIKDRKIVIDPETLTVKAFNDIWNYDRSSTKSNASNLLTYVFTMNEEREFNPFRDVEWDKKEQACKLNAFGNAEHKFNKEEIDLIDKATEWFKFLNSSSIQRLSRATDQAFDRIATYISTKEILTDDDLENVTKHLAKVEGMIKGKKSADKEMREEMDKTKLKGGGKQSLNSQKMI